MTWGYDGEGPKDFSLNILLHFSGGDLNFARKFGSDFCREVISRLPQTSGVIPASLIKAWIEPRLNKNVLPYGPSWDWAEIKDEYLHRESEFIKSA